MIKVQITLCPYKLSNYKKEKRLNIFVVLKSYMNFNFYFLTF